MWIAREYDKAGLGGLGVDALTDAGEGLEDVERAGKGMLAVVGVVADLITG